MLSYQHSYHAGGFADVIKHLVQTRLIDYLIKKEKPLLYLDTHSGRGLYDLESPHAQKTKEASLGIHCLWSERDRLPHVFLPYIDAITQLNQTSTLRYYPGSPKIAIQMLRNQDRIVLHERHPQEFEYLTQLSHQQKRVYCYDEDGLHSLKAQLPPVERRGLIFVDPAYELKTEYRDVISNLKTAHKRFSTGVYCLWYPIIDAHLHQQFIKNLRTIDTDSSLRIEFYTTNKPTLGMYGCGLWIINPPYVLAEEATQALQVMKKLINPGTSYFVVE